MILKIESHDSQHRLETKWVPGITGANRCFDDNLGKEMLSVTFANGTVENRPINPGEGMYLCNDDGKTLEVLSRLNRTIK